MARRKIRYDRLALVALVCILSISVIGFASVSLFSDLFGGKKPNGQGGSTAVTETKNDSTELSLIDYSVFEDSDNMLGFDFVLAKIKFSDKNSISFDLNRLNAGSVNLGDVSYYKNRLEQGGYYPSKMNVVYTVESASNEYICTILVPCKIADQIVTLSDKNGNSIIQLDLTRNHQDLSTLKYQSGEIIVSDDFDISISSSFISTKMNRNGQSYQYPSNIQIYTFRMRVNSIKEGTVLEEALFVQDSSDEIYDSLGSEYSVYFNSTELKSMIGTQLKENGEYALFFEVFNQFDSMVDYSGTLKLKFSNSDNWIELNTDLK